MLATKTLSTVRYTHTHTHINASTLTFTWKRPAHGVFFFISARKNRRSALYTIQRTHWKSPIRATKERYTKSDHIIQFWVQRVYEWMEEWINERTSERASEQTNEQAGEPVSKKVSEWMNEWTSEQTNKRICIDMTDNLVVRLSFVKVTHFSKFLIHSQIQRNERTTSSSSSSSGTSNGTTLSCWLYWCWCHRCHCIHTDTHWKLKRDPPPLC